MTRLNIGHLTSVLGSAAASDFRELTSFLLENPGSPGALSKLAWLLSKEDQADAGAAILTWALAVAPAMEPMLRLDLDRLVKAVPYRRTLAETAFRKCVLVDPKSSFAMAIGGLIRRNANELASAKTVFRRAQILDPDGSFPREQIWKIDSDWGWGNRGFVGNFVLPNGGKDSDTRFYRTATTRFFPRHLAEFDDLDRILRRDIFHGYLPEVPLIRADQPIVAMGSCFAQHIRQHLLAHGRLSEHVPIPEGLNNTFAIRQFVDWVEGRDDLVYAYEKTADGRMERWDADKQRSAFVDALRAAGGFIATIGVAEVWRDKRTGGVFWRGVPEDKFDPSVHEHALSTVAENTDNLRAIADGLRRLAGDVPVVFTLSPVPLVATMRAGTSIFAADAVSKSTLRLAIEAVMQEAAPGVHYWPSFEAFRWLGAHIERRLYDGESNPRHPSPDMIARMIDLFISHFIADDAPQAARR